MWIMGARPVQKTVPFACHASGGTTVLHLRRIFRACLPWVLGAAVVVVVSACCENRAVIRDLRHFPQDAFRYFDQSQGNRLLLSDGAQSVLDQQFNRHFFSPWHRLHPVYDKGEILERLERFSANLGYGENRQPHDPKWLEDLRRAAALDTFPNAGFPGITVAASNLRELPTSKPHFKDFDLPGEGFPFDNLQYSAIPANTPVYVSHVSADGAWTLVESHFGLGWVPSADIARADAGLRRTWEIGHYVAMTKDNQSAIDDQGRFLFRVGVGQILPLCSRGADHYRVWVAVADENRGAHLKEISLPLQAVVRKPLAFTMNHIAGVINQFMGQPYGWGGLYGNRDCSSTLKDLFVPFGIWLPRNSFHQAHGVGKFVPFEDLSTKDKTRKILVEGSPLLTLLWSPGHIALYLGEYAGQPMVFHNLWGIRTRDGWGREGRKVIGHAAITGVHPGAELCQFDPTYGDLLNRIEGMALLVSPDSGQQPLPDR